MNLDDSVATVNTFYLEGARIEGDGHTDRPEGGKKGEDEGVTVRPAIH